MAYPSPYFHEDKTKLSHELCQNHCIYGFSCIVNMVSSSERLSLCLMMSAAMTIRPGRLEAPTLSFFRRLL